MKNIAQDLADCFELCHYLSLSLIDKQIAGNDCIGIAVECRLRFVFQDSIAGFLIGCCRIGLQILFAGFAGKKRVYIEFLIPEKNTGKKCSKNA